MVRRGSVATAWALSPASYDVDRAGLRGVRRDGVAPRGARPLIERRPGAPPSTQAERADPQQKAQAQRTILSALSATTSSGSYNVSYEFDPATPPTATATATTSGCTVIGNSSTGSGSGGTSEVCPATPNPFSATTVTGQGTIDTDPFAMVATSDVTGLGMITIRDNGTDIWEFGGGDYGLEPGRTKPARVRR